MSLALLVIMPINSYRDLQAWQLGMALTEEVYALTRAFPKDELFGLTSQLRRAATGIPSHIAEGHQHGINAYRHYVTIALGSQAECETQLELALRLKFASPEKINKVKDRAAEVGRVLHGLSRSLSRAASRG